MTPAACARCGSFQEALTTLAERPLCKECLGRMTASATLYSATAATAVAVLLNPTPAAVMLALNYRRLENPGRARLYAIAAAVLALVYAALIVVDPPNKVFLGLGFVVGFSLTAQWRTEFALLETIGFKRRNPWWVVLVTVGVLVGFVVAYALIATALNLPG